MAYTLIIVIITVLTSLAAFNDTGLRSKLIMYPRIMSAPSEYYRLLTSGFIHSDWPHLFFNMYALYGFGRIAEESILGDFFGRMSGLIYVFFYLSGIILASVPNFFKHRDNAGFASLGASGGVSAVVFFVIYYFPWSKVGIIFIPIGIPAILFAALYTLYTIYMSKRGGDNIDHEAHMGGAIYGLVFALLVDPTHGQMFLYQIMHPVF